MNVFFTFMTYLLAPNHSFSTALLGIKLAFPSAFKMGKRRFYRIPFATKDFRENESLEKMRFEKTRFSSKYVIREKTFRENAI